MKRTVSASSWRSWLAWAMLAPTAMGCRSFFASEGPPRDPLFLSKTPMSAKAEITPPLTFAYLEPAVPRDPFSEGNAPSYADRNNGTAPGKLTNRSKERTENVEPKSDNRE